MDSGRIVAAGYGDSGGVMGTTLVKIGALKHRFQAFKLPDLQREPERGDGFVRFVQTTGGRTGLPAPRRVRRKPYVQWRAPLVWTTLSLTLHADGRTEAAMIGASPFPRHWVYDDDGRLSHKSGLTDFRDWYAKSFGRHSPWGDEDSEALVTAVESALERSLSGQLMHGGKKPHIEHAAAGTVIVRQGEPGSALYLILDGVVRIEHSGERLAEYGPGAMLGERSHLEGRCTDLDAGGRDGLPPRLGRRRPARPLRSRHARRRTPYARTSGCDRCGLTCAVSAVRHLRRDPSSCASAVTPRALPSQRTAMTSRRSCSTPARACAA